MSDTFTDVAKMRKIKEEIKAHEGKMVEMTLENGRKRQKNKQGRLIEVYPSLFIVEYTSMEVNRVRLKILMSNLTLIQIF